LFDRWESDFMKHTEYESDSEWFYRLRNLQTAHYMFLKDCLNGERLQEMIKEERKELLQSLAFDAIYSANKTDALAQFKDLSPLADFKTLISSSKN
jgi:hypothetical protein